MSRMTGDTVIVKPTSNIYTVLVIVACMVSILAFVAGWTKYSTLFGENMLPGGKADAKTANR